VRVVKKIDLTRYFPHILFSICTLIYIFTVSGEGDMFPFDARFNAALANYQSSDVGRSLSLRADFLFGNGTLQWGYLWWLEPTTLVGSIFGPYNSQLVNFVFSLLIFSLTEVFLRQLDVPRLERISASALCAITTMWGYSIAIVDNDLFAHVPQYASQLCVTFTLLISLYKIEQANLKKSILLASFVLLDSIFLVMVFPQIFITVLPFIFAVVVASWTTLLVTKNFFKLFKSVLSAVIVCVVLLLLNAHKYLESFYLGNAASATPFTELSKWHTKDPRIFLFESLFSHPSSKGEYFVQWFCFYALVIFLLRGLFFVRYRNRLWLALGLGVSILVSYRYWQRRWIFEEGPRQSYVIWAMIPLYTAAVSSMFFDLFRFLRKFRARIFLNRLPKFNAELLVVAIPVLIAISPISSIQHFNQEPTIFRLTSNLITPEIVQELSVKDDQNFNGRIAFMGPELDYRSFIQDRIPMLNDYSHNLSPLAYRFQREFFWDGRFEQRRNSFKFGATNLQVYELLGIKYLTAWKPQRFKVSSFSRLDRSEFRKDYFWKNYEVVELKEPNLGDYSPTNVTVVANLESVYKNLKLLDLKQNIVLFSDPKMSLQAARESKMTIVDGDIRVVAESAGDSVLVLPFEFSSCINFEEKSEKSNFIRAELANGLLTAVFFSKNLDLTISYRLGLFENQDCRLKDLELYRSITEGF
jgi:hypothetical protein